jgi:predicted NBD/HSP70 family sugar kinase
VLRCLILNLIRTQHLISRADLARLSGLQRSTVSLIVEQLIDEHWVEEGPTGRLPRGRRPTFPRLNDKRVPSRWMFALPSPPWRWRTRHGRFLSLEMVATSPAPEITIEALIQSIQRLIRSGHKTKVEGVGISLPGRYDDKADRLVFAPNLHWPDIDIRSPIAKATGLDVTVENAANACVLAAVWFDRMEECRNLVAVTISEGIGTGVWANGQLVRGLNGMAGEFGHVPLDPDGPLCSCGGHGCWEVFASNRAALRYYLESGSEAGEFSFPDLLNRADNGDQRAAQSLETMAHTWDAGCG